MRHPDDGTLMALLDGEIPSRELPTLTAHLEGCAECRGRIEAARAMMAEADGLVNALDDAAPAGRPEREAAVPGGTRLRHPQLLAWAATVVLAIGLGYALRGALPAPEPPPATLAMEAPGAEVPAPLPEAATTTTAGAEPSAAPPRTPPPATAMAKVDMAAADTAPRTGLPPPPATPPAAGEAAGGVPAEARREASALAQGVAATPEALRPAASRMMAPLADPAPMAAADRAAVELEAFEAVSFPEAVARLGGTLRLIQGMVPLRLEASRTMVRVVYPLQAGELMLEQRRVGDSVRVLLRGPLSADSLAVLRGRVR